MTECDHGIRLDAFCEACEDGWFRDAMGIPDDYFRESRRRSRQWLPLLLVAGLVLIAVRLSR